MNSDSQDAQNVADSTALVECPRCSQIFPRNFSKDVMVCPGCGSKGRGGTPNSNLSKPVIPVIPEPSQAVQQPVPIHYPQTQPPQYYPIYQQWQEPSHKISLKGAIIFLVAITAILVLGGLNAINMMEPTNYDSINPENIYDISITQGETKNVQLHFSGFPTDSSGNFIRITPSIFSSPWCPSLEIPSDAGEKINNSGEVTLPVSVGHAIFSIPMECEYTVDHMYDDSDFPRTMGIIKLEVKPNPVYLFSYGAIPTLALVALIMFHRKNEASQEKGVKKYFTDVYGIKYAKWAVYSFGGLLTCIGIVIGFFLFFTASMFAGGNPDEFNNPVYTLIIFFPLYLGMGFTIAGFILSSLSIAAFRFRTWASEPEAGKYVTWGWFIFSVYSMGSIFILFILESFSMY